MKKSVFPYDREGAWSIIHPFYYECAYRSFKDFQTILLLLRNEEQRIRAETLDIEEPDLTGYVQYKTGDLHKEAFRLSTASFLFLCMTIESFLNHYGTKRLGESYYKRNLERIGITEKLSLLMAVCNQAKLEAKDPVLIKLRALFDRRNSLVHPKTKEFDPERPEDFITKHPAEIDLQANFDDMEFIIEKLCEFDSKINRYFEFQKRLEEMGASASKDTDKER
jgi:hypothetical protein